LTTKRLHSKASCTACEDNKKNGSFFNRKKLGDRDEPSHWKKWCLRFALPHPAALRVAPIRGAGAAVDGAQCQSIEPTLLIAGKPEAE
jgi:hypothetical protein